MSEHNYKFDVKMHCSGCSGAVEKVLKATDGMYTHPFIYNNARDTRILISPLTCEKNKQKASHTTSPSKSKRSKSSPTLFRTRLCSRRSKRLGNRSRLGRRTVNLLISNQNPIHTFNFPFFPTFPTHLELIRPCSPLRTGETGRSELGDSDGLI